MHNKSYEELWINGLIADNLMHQFKLILFIMQQWINQV